MRAAITLWCDISSYVTTKDHNSQKEKSSSIKLENDVTKAINLDGNISTFHDYDLRENNLEIERTNVLCEDAAFESKVRKRGTIN